MTASLPVPREPIPDDPDESVARTGDGEIVEFVKSGRPASTARPQPKRPTKPRAPRKRTPRVAPADPGPPPPLPPEFDAAAEPASAAAIPPKPEIPADLAAAAADVPLPPKPAAPVRRPPVKKQATTTDAAPAAPLPPKPAMPADVITYIPVPQALAPKVVEAEAPEAVEAEAVQPEVTQLAFVAPDAVAAEAPEAVQPDVVEPDVVEPDVVEPEGEAAVVVPDLVEAEAEAEIVKSELPEPGAVHVAEAGVVVVPDAVSEVDDLDVVVEPEPEAVAEPDVAEPEPAEPDAVVEIEDAAVVETEVESAPVDEIDALLDLEPELAAADGVDIDAEAAAIAAVFDDVHVESSADEDSAALMLRGVSKSFGENRAVEGIDLTVPAGSFYGLVGPNGAGKTTTLSMIAGLLAPDRGVIRVGGVDAAAKPLAAKRLLGVLPDRLRTFDRLTGRQLLYYYGVLRGLSSSVVESRTADLARAFDLTDALGRVVSDYSAGMLKKVMLAGAMIHSPRVLVLDEPFEAVDPVSSAVILDILSAYVAHGGTVILSSHGMDLVERVCTRVAVIVAGQVLAEGTIEEVRGELTLEQRFIELAGGLSDVEGLEWLHTFSD